jgi:hypothetical protein
MNQIFIRQLEETNEEQNVVNTRNIPLTKFYQVNHEIQKQNRIYGYFHSNIISNMWK